MPELPEVEAVAQALRPLVEGRRIRRARVLHPIAVRPSSGRGARRAAQDFAARLRGRRIARVGRRGKYLVLELDRGCVVMHFRLDGQLVWFDSHSLSGHICAALDIDSGTLGFVDRRHFGRVQYFAQADDLPGIRALGVDPLTPEFTAGRLAEILRSRRPLKLLLLDQARIAGLGNIYSSEALWRARLDPRRRAHRVRPAEARRLHKAIVAVLHRALECCLHPAPDFRDPDWWFQGLEAILRVYGREGKACRRCGAAVRRIEQGGRSTYACFRCQK
jgi:formamidopyrimidine-DNA glycosylase